MIESTEMPPKLPRHPLPFAWHFIKKFKWPWLAMLILDAGQAGSQILLSSAIKNIIDIINSLERGLSQEEVFSYVGGAIWTFVGLSLGVLIFSRSSGTLMVYLSPALRRLIKYEIYSYLQYHAHNFFTSHFAGSLANRVSTVAVGISHSLWTVTDIWVVLITFSVSMVLLIQTHLELAFYLGSWIVLYVVISFLWAMRARYYAKEFAAARSTVSGKIVDSVTNIFNVQMFSRLGYERKYLTTYLDLEVKKSRGTFWFMEKISWFQSTAALILQVGIMYLAVLRWIQGSITVGEFTMATTLSLLVISHAIGLSRQFLNFFENFGNISDGVEVIIQDHEVKDKERAVPLQITKGEIECRDVHFKYNNMEKDLFKGMNVKIASGEKVGLVGFSGAGKSTFVNLLARLYDIQKGNILIDGQSLLEVTKDSLREKISMIPQHPMLFHRSLMENIRYGKLSATEEEVIEASRLAFAHEFIEDLPQGYHSLVGERGVKLSGGQRQRVAIAMAILKDAPILILDEATSSLDSKTEKLIQHGLNNLMKDKTVVSISHRLSTINHMDRILVLNQGQIIEQGTHSELLAMDGHYAMLWEMQAGGFLPLELVEEI